MSWANSLCPNSSTEINLQIGDSTMTDDANVLLKTDADKQVNFSPCSCHCQSKDPTLPLQINSKCDCFHFTIQNYDSKKNNSGPTVLESTTKTKANVDQTVPGNNNSSSKPDLDTSEFDSFSSLNFYKQCNVRGTTY